MTLFPDWPLADKVRQWGNQQAGIRIRIRIRTFFASGSVNWQNSMEDSWATSVYLSELQKPIPFVREVPLLEISLIDILVHV